MFLFSGPFGEAAAVVVFGDDNDEDEEEEATILVVLVGECFNAGGCWGGVLRRPRSSSGTRDEYGAVNLCCMLSTQSESLAES